MLWRISRCPKMRYAIAYLTRTSAIDCLRPIPGMYRAGHKTLLL